MIQASAGPMLPADAVLGDSGRAVIDAEVDWEAISQRLRRYGLALCGRPEEAEDLAQQTLAALLSKAPHRADHMGYARQTLTRLWLDRQRSVRRRVARWWKLAVGSVGSHTADASSAERQEQLAALQRGIEMLPPRQQVILTLRLVEGLEYTAIAEAIGCEVSAVRANLHLARAKLRSMLGEMESD